MSLLDLFRPKKPRSASVAKERLQIIVSHERRKSTSPDFLPQLQTDILNVVRKYLPINEEQINLSLERRGEREILELNISLSETGDS